MWHGSELSGTSKTRALLHLHSMSSKLEQRSIRLFKYKKYYILCAELYHRVKLFDEKLYVCETCHKDLNKNVIPCQEVCNKIDLAPIPDELKNLKKIEKIHEISKKTSLKIAIMHGKGEFSKIKGRICNIPIETANIYNILPRPAVSNGLVQVKLKRDIKYSGHLCFQRVRPHITYQALAYLKSHNKFYEDISIAKDRSSDVLIRFLYIVEIQGKNKNVKKYF